MTMILGEHHRTLGIFQAAVVDRLHSLGIAMTSHNHVACNSTVAGAMAQICQETICVVGTKPQYLSQQQILKWDEVGWTVGPTKRTNSPRKKEVIYQSMKTMQTN